MFGRNKGTLITAVIVGTLLIVYFARKSKWADYDAIFLLTPSCPEARLPQACRFAGFATVHPDFPLWGLKYSQITHPKTPLDQVNKSRSVFALGDVKNRDFTCSSHAAFAIFFAPHKRNGTLAPIKGNLLVRTPSSLHLRINVC
ncbi:unnamed protein product [Dibothriocephalus latus]|uniref:Uncharacterized protein n=1 Tax=Dibothriocephalus latus TaxID=60516 RepID=A0A3P7LP44_DIBLA|nr:unnamed protein product [Dibothriocephalus latus]